MSPRIYANPAALPLFRSRFARGRYHTYRLPKHDQNSFISSRSFFSFFMFRFCRISAVRWSLAGGVALGVTGLAVQYEPLRMEEPHSIMKALQFDINRPPDLLPPLSKDSSILTLLRYYWVYRLSEFKTTLWIADSVLSRDFGDGLLSKALWGMVKNTVFSVFVGGETVEEALPLMRAYEDQGITCMLDYTSERVNHDAKVNKSHIDEIKRLISFLHKDSIVAIKLSSLMRSLKDRDPEAFGGLLEIGKLASSKGVKLFIDAEEKELQSDIDFYSLWLAQQLPTDNVIVYNTYQAYRRDTLDRIKRDTEIAKRRGFNLGVKLVRGAYLKSERLIDAAPFFDTKEGTDAQYDACVGYVLEQIKSPGNRIALCVASHNRKSVMLSVERMLKLGLAQYLPDKKHIQLTTDKVLFSQLHAMCDDLTLQIRELIATPFVVSKCTPYAPVSEAMPYLLRRARENSDILTSESGESPYKRSGSDDQRRAIGRVIRTKLSHMIGL